MNTAPIGFFDSGIGGTSIWQAVQSELPNEHTYLIADSGNAPYGEKSVAEIQKLCCRNTEMLLEKGCKLIVVACNTASVNAIAFLRQCYDVPFIAIEPAIKPAAIASQRGVIGILATKQTLASQRFKQSVAEHVHSRGVELIARHGSGIVELLESGEAESSEMSALLREHCRYFRDAGIDQLVLGCTHYSYLIPQLSAYLPAVEMVDSRAAIARQAYRVLEKNDLLNQQKITPTHQWYSSGDTALLRRFAPQKQNITIAKIEREQAQSEPSRDE